MKRFIAIILCALFLIGCVQTTKDTETKSLEPVVENEISNPVMLDSDGKPVSLSTAKPTSTVSETAKANEIIPEPTKVPNNYYCGTWETYGVKYDSGEYYNVERLKEIGEDTLANIRIIIDEDSASSYVDGQWNDGVFFRIIDKDVYIGTLCFTLQDSGFLCYKSLAGYSVYMRRTSTDTNKNIVDTNIKKQTEAPAKTPKPTSKVQNTSSPTKKPTSKPTSSTTKKPTVTAKPTATVTKKPTEKPTKAPTQKPTEAPQVTPKTYTYILNTDTKKFHKPGCRDIEKMNESNKKYYTGLREDVINMGYSPCGHCHP